MKNWGKWLQPDIVLGGSILDLTPEILQHHNLKGLVLDVDETLVPFSAIDASEELLHWANGIRAVADIWLVSNNISEPRIRRIADALELPYIAGAGKPSRRKLRRAVEMLNLPVDQVAMVGDRLFTDVLAGNRLGMCTVLVTPMVGQGGPRRRSWTHAVEIKLSQIMGVSLIPNTAHQP